VFRTNHTRYVDYYDDDTRRLVGQLYATDVAEFGYRFGE
jgi:hypothetical protein